MADLVCTCSCSEALMIGTIPDDCGSIDYGYPYIFLLQNPNAVNSFAGDTPTVVEIEALMLAPAGEIHIAVLGPITNGKKEESGRESESGADTIDGLDNVLSQTIKLSGKFKLLNDTILAQLAQLNCRTRVRMWYITSKGYLFGGDGITIPSFFSEWLHDGFGTRSYVPIEFSYKVDRTKDYSDTAQDDDYLTLNN